MYYLMFSSALLWMFSFFKKNFPICKMRLTFLKFKFQIPGRTSSSKLDNVSSNHVTRSSLGSHINYNSTPQRRSPSPYSNSIITMTREDGRIERRLETCSYQETEMVRKITDMGNILAWNAMISKTKSGYERLLIYRSKYILIIMHIILKWDSPRALLISL